MRNKTNTLRDILLLTAALFFIGACSFHTMTFEDETKITVEHVAASGDIRYTATVTDAPVDIIFSFTNVHESQDVLLPDVDGDYITINGVSYPAPTAQALEPPLTNRHPFRVFLDESTRELTAALDRGDVQKNTFPLPGPPSFDAVNDPGSFTVVDGNNNVISEAATCRAVVPDITTEQGERTLNIWVADDCWGGDGGDVVEITTPMIDALVEKFLKVGADNDIYDWVTSIVGPEWGDTGYTNIIPMNAEITILLADINKENTEEGVIVGYFWPVHNFIDDPAQGGFAESNERIMFTIDAVMYANASDDGSLTDTNGWATTDYWPRIVFSTLAHEFQHMIHFYQKTILRAGEYTETWIDEMCSMLTEDFLADKMGVEGPRGVAPADGTAGSANNTLGRLPWFNQYLSRSVLAVDEFLLADYPVAYALGAFLARNYGGAEFLNRVVCSPYTDKAALEYAVREYTGGDETFEHLLERWGSAIFLSDKTEAPPWYRYNSGTWFASSINSKTYNLGSINLFNYSPGPEYALSSNELTQDFTPGSNVYILAAEDALGDYSWNITVPEDVRLTVIFKGQ